MSSDENRRGLSGSTRQRINALNRELAELEKQKGQLEVIVAECRKIDETERLLVAKALNLWHRNMLPEDALRAAQKKAMPASKNLDKAERELECVCSRIDKARKERGYA